MTKSDLRSVYLRQRKELSSEELQDRSARIAETFFHEVDLLSVNYLHVFIPIRKNNEPNTWLIIDRVRESFPETSIVVPRINDTSGKIDNYRYEGRESLAINSWGIEEPRSGLTVQTEEIDMVLVPLLAFDVNGNRVGYGKGFYDRFLRECRADCQRIGISLFEAVDQISDVDEFDEPLHRCITPSLMVSF
jgi:5-formyltetrahydrofolate cyclo-ligase